MATLKPRERFIAFWAGTAVFLLFWFYAIWQPIESFNEKINAELRSKDVKLYEAKKILAAAPQNSVLEDSLKRFYSDGSAQEDMSRLIKEIETAATGAGLKVIETKPEPLLKHVGWHELKVNIAFEGRWSDVVRFLYMIDNGPKPLLVNEMTLEANLPQQTIIRGRLEIGRLLVSLSAEP